MHPGDPGQWTLPIHDVRFDTEITTEQRIDTAHHHVHDGCNT